MTPTTHETSYTTGTKGKNRVRLYVDTRRGGALYVEYKDDDGARRSQRLQTTDWLEAKELANKIARTLGSVDASPPVLTVGRLFDNWLTEITATKGGTTKTAERASLAILREAFGASTKVTDLDARDWESFIERRRAGTLRLATSHCSHGVANRTIAMDLKLLRSVIKRAMRLKERGRRLLELDPFEGCKVPAEPNPKRPSLTNEEYTKLVTAAEQDDDPQVLLYLQLAHECGHRLSAVRQLRWSDVDLRRGLVRWRAEFDKKRREHITPLSPRAVEILSAQALIEGRTDESSDAWLFRSPTEPTRPVAKALVADWWRRLEKRAELPHVDRRGWHSLRRKFATDLKHLPMADLLALGNWRDGGVVVRSYMKADEATMRTGLATRTAR